MKTKHETNLQINGGAFFINGPNVHIEPLYRGAVRGTNSAFSQGFASQGQNPDLMSHCFQGNEQFTFSEESGYVSTSYSKLSAEEYAKHKLLSSKAPRTYCYEINPHSNAIDVGGFLEGELRAGRLSQSDYTFIAWEKEMAVPLKIEPQDVKGAWEMVYSETGEPVRGKYIHNPKYIPPLSQATDVLKAVGRAGVGVGIAVDGTKLWYAFQDGQESGDYHLFFNEGARVVGGWSGAISLGTAGAKMGAVWLSPLTPAASLVGSAVLGLAGSVVGYSIGGAISEKIESFFAKALHEITLIPYMVTSGLSFVSSAHATEVASQTASTFSTRGTHSMRKFTYAETAKLPRFKCSDPSEVDTLMRPAKLFNPTELKNIQEKTKSTDESYTFRYVVTSKNEFKVALHLGPGYAEPLLHVQLAGDESVIAAGEIKFANGECVVDNGSGHYKPCGKDLEDFMLGKMSELGINTNVRFEYWPGTKTVDTASPHLVPEKKSTQQAHHFHQSIHDESAEDYFPQVFFATGSAHHQPTNPQQQTQYEMQRLIRYYTNRLDSALVRPEPIFYELSPRQNLERLAHVMSTSHSGFCTTAERIARISTDFLRSDNPQAAAFIRHSIYQLQWEYFQEVQHYSEISPIDTYETMNRLMEDAQIPPENRPFYQQHCLSVLAAMRDEASPSAVFNTVNFDEGRKSDVLGLLKRKAENEKLSRISSAEKQDHHRAFSQSTQKMQKALGVKQLPIAGGDITPEQAALLAETKRTQRDVSEMLLRQQTQESIDGFRTGAQFLTMLGQVTRDRSAQQIGTLATSGVMAYQACTGLSALTATSTFGATLGPIGMAGMAALTVVSMLMSNDDDERGDDPFRAQVMMALSQIMENLNHVRREMHERFDRIEQNEMQSRLLFLKGFDAVLTQAEKIIGHHLQSHYAAEKLATKVDSVASDMHAGFEAIQDTLIKPIMSGILKPSSSGYLRNLSISEVSTRKERLFFFLTGTSCLPTANGYHRISDDGAVSIGHDVIAKALRNQSETAVKKTSAPSASSFHQLSLPGYYHQTTLTLLEKQIALDVFTSAYPDHHIDLVRHNPEDVLNILHLEDYNKENQIYVLDRPVDLNTLKSGYYVRILTLPGNKFHVYGVEVLSPGNVFVHENIPQDKFVDHCDQEFKDQLIALNNQSKVIFRTAKTKGGGLELHQYLAREYVEKGKVGLFQSGLQTAASQINIPMPKLFNLLGLLAGLGNHYVGSNTIADYPETLLNPSQWRPAIVAYEKLLTECNPALGFDKTSHLAEIGELSGRLEKLQTFLRKVSLNKQLFEKLVGNYHDSLSDIEKLIIAHLEKQEMEYYRKSVIQIASAEHLIRLDETFDEASGSYQGEYFLESCARTPVHFQGRTNVWTYSPGVHNSDVILTEDLNIIERYANSACQGGACNSQGHCTCQNYNASQAAWSNIITHHNETEKPALERMYAPAIRKQLSLGLRLQQLSLEKSLDMNFICRDDNTADKAHLFQSRIKLKDNEPLIFITCSSNYYDLNQDHRNYQKMQMTQDIYRCGKYSGSEWTITTVDKKELEALSKKTAARVHQLLKSYRDQAITELLSDVRFTQALEKLESCALQIYAFSNLMGINPKEFESPLRKTWMEKFLSDIQKSDATQSIAHIKKMLCHLRDRTALEASDLLGATPSDITRNPLYKWAAESITDLGELESKVNAWTDVVVVVPQAQNTDVTLLHEEIKELRKEVAASRRAVIEMETDSSDDEDGFERETRTKVESMGHIHAGRFWKKRPGDEAGVRALDQTIPKNIRDSLFTTPPKGRKIEKEKIPGGEKMLVTQLATIRVRR